jgi:tetratricopeptide (TPR) repeat protein
MILSGKVVIGDGTTLTEPAAIQTVCKGRKRTETHTDSRGNFSFQFGGSSSSSEFAFDADATDERAATGQPERRDLQGCELQASLAGFSSDVIQLDGRFSQSDNVDLGRIALHRLQNVEGLTISATTAMAPDPARKAWEKGRKQAEQGKWDEAQKSLEKAVGIYPNFAAAWSELGQVQIQKNDRAAARQSFEHSIAADSKYINPYLGLAQLALRSRNWVDLTVDSEKVLALNPISFPDAWFWDSLGHYYLRNLAEAEKSAHRGLEIDSEHRVPKLEYLLGIVLLAKPDYPEAAQHLRTFLSLATKPADIAEAQKQLDEVARLSAGSAADGKK